jgi:hypothetical protein
VALIVWDYQWYAVLPANTLPSDAPRAIADLAEREGVRAVLDVPWDNLLVAKDALYLQTIHHKPLIAGQVSRQTPIDPAKLNLLQATLDPDLLQQAGADVVIVHKGRMGEGDALAALLSRARAQLGTPFYEDARLALFQTPIVDEEAGFRWVVGASRADFYLYAPAPMWADFDALLWADGRRVIAALDGAPLHRYDTGRAHPIGEAYFLSAGYHTLALSLDPPCPRVTHPALECGALQALAANWRAVGGSMLDAPIAFSDGLVLLAARWDEVGDAVIARLWWRSDAPRAESDVRFVHLVAADGALLAQDDRSAGARPAGAQWTEKIVLPKAGQMGDSYRLAVGWYRLPDVVRFDVLSDVDGAIDKLVWLKP